MATQVAIAKHLYLSRNAVHTWQAKGVIPKGASLDEAYIAYVGHLRQRIAADEADSEQRQGDTDHRIRLVKEHADNMALKNDEVRSNVAPVEVITWVVGNVGQQIAAILGKIPDKIKARLPDLPDDAIDVARHEVSKAQAVALDIRVDGMNGGD